MICRVCKLQSSVSQSPSLAASCLAQVRYRTGTHNALLCLLRLAGRHRACARALPSCTCEERDRQSLIRGTVWLLLHLSKIGLGDEITFRQSGGSRRSLRFTHFHSSSTRTRLGPNTDSRPATRSCERAREQPYHHRAAPSCPRRYRTLRMRARLPCAAINEETSVGVRRR